jgi:predicted HNH restriction endonuclease
VGHRFCVSYEEEFWVEERGWQRSFATRGGFELPGAISLSSEGFDDQTDQRIRSGIRKKNEMKTKRIKAKKRNRLG